MDNKDFTTGSITKKLIGFMIPIFFAMALQAMYGAVDLLIVGRFGSASGISGVTTGASITQFFTFVVCSLSTGVTVLIGQYIGQKKFDKIGPVLGSAILIFGSIAIILTIVMSCFSKNIAILMQAPTEAIDTTSTYIKICGFGFIFVVSYNLISGILRGIGESKLPLLFVGISCVINIILDLIFVKDLNLDVFGAALATIISQAISVFSSLFIIKKKKLPLKIKLKDLKIIPDTKRYLQIGIPLAFQEVLTNISFLAICAFINSISLEASSGYGIGGKVQSFIFLIPDAIIQSMAPFVAQNVGAGLEDRAKKAMITGIKYGSLIGIFFVIFIFFKGDLIASLFSNNQSYIDCAFDYLRGFSLDALLTCTLFSFYGYFNGHGKSSIVMILGLTQSLLIRLPMSYFMSIRENASLFYIGLAAPIATLFGIILCLIFYFRIYYTKKS